MPQIWHVSVHIYVRICVRACMYVCVRVCLMGGGAEQQVVGYELTLAFRQMTLHSDWLI